jgi:hypothetical protein
MRDDNGNILKISFIDMHNIKKARCKVLYSGALINQKISVIKFTGTPENIKNINNNFLPECCFVEKEESGLFYLNTSNKLLFFVRKKIIEGVERKELLNINDWISVNPYNEAKLIKEKDFHRTVTLED